MNISFSKSGGVFQPHRVVNCQPLRETHQLTKTNQTQTQCDTFVNSKKLKLNDNGQVRKS